MRTKFSGHFKPSEKEFETLWKKAVFCLDANVLLNLYRYSEPASKTLANLLEFYKGRVFLPNQSAKEYLGNRLSVTSGQISEYTKAVRTLEELAGSFSEKNRHPSLPEDMEKEVLEYFDKLITMLKDKQNEKNQSLTNDELLDFSSRLFDGKTGDAYTDKKLSEIKDLGEQRYALKVPPGYKDDDKSEALDPMRKFGDLVVWFQIMDYAKNKKKPVIFITDDKKEDWWLIQSGKTISPRPELLEEFHRVTNQPFWMYSVDRFIKLASEEAKKEVDPAVIEEVKTLPSFRSRTETDYEESNITSYQEVETSTSEFQEGQLHVTLHKPMRYASANAKFKPRVHIVPEISVNLYDYPEQNENNIKVSTGCGTLINFNVHLKGTSDLLRPGTYSFKYKVIINPVTVGQSFVAGSSGAVVVEKKKKVIIRPTTIPTVNEK